MRNTALQKAATNVLTDPAAVYFRVKLTFSNSTTGSTWTFIPYVIDSLVFDYDFIENCYENITVTATMAPKDYAQMQDQGQALQALLTLTYVTENNTRLYSPAPVQKKYRVLLKDAIDIRKAVPDVQLYTTPSHQFSFQLMEETVYQARLIKLGVAYQSTTVSNVIHSLTEGYGVSTLSMVTPDNTHTYDHIIMPSYVGMTGAYGFLHSHHGVYCKGMGYYLQNSCMYIYPPYETNPTSDRTITFFQVKTGKYSGLSCRHKKVGNNYQVVIDSQPVSVDHSIAGVENHGTGISFIHANALTDGYTTIDANKGASFNSNTGSVISLTNSRTLDTDVNHINHVVATDNPYPHMSMLALRQASIMHVPWPGADPYSVIPNTKVVYCYDRNGTMMKKTGIVEHAHFEMKKMNTTGTMTMYGCTGNLTLRLSLNESLTL